MSIPQWGRCDDCGETASLKRVTGDPPTRDNNQWLCPKCRWERKNPEEPPLY